MGNFQSKKISIVSCLWCWIPIVFAWQIVLAWPALQVGILADNDSVANLSYVQLLMDEPWQTSGWLWRWNDRFNGGAPFLLFNVPPGFHLLAAAAGKMVGDARTGMLLGLFLAYFANPWTWGYLARTIFGGGARICVATAAAASLVTSELFGLSFLFANGMCNAAFASAFIPLAIALVLNVCRSDALKRTQLGAAVSVCSMLLLTHLGSTYMVGFGAALLMLFGAGGQFPNRQLIWRCCSRFVSVWIFVALITAFWWLPSSLYVESPDVSNTWLRSPEFVWRYWQSGQAISGSVSCFAERKHVVTPFGGYPAMLLALAALGWFWRSWQVRAVGILLLAAAWVTLGPSFAGPLVSMPGYTTWHYFRMTTLAVGAVILLAGKMSVHLATRRLGVVVLALLAAVTARDALRLRAVIEYDQAYPDFLREVDAVASFLKSADAKPGRIYSEFYIDLEVPSVNYLRHRLPILSGRDEIAGWVIENSPISLSLLQTGAMWSTVAPMLELAAGYSVRYIVAVSQPAKGLLQKDSRWHEAKVFGRITVFELVDLLAPPSPKLVGENFVVEHETRRFSGNYRWVITTPEVSESLWQLHHAWSPTWQIRVDDMPVAYERTAQGTMLIRVPALAAGSHVVHATWTAGSRECWGIITSLLGLSFFLLLLLRNQLWAAAALAARWSPPRTALLLTAGGMATYVAVSWVTYQSPHAPSITGGLHGLVPFDRIRFGVYNSDSMLAPNHIMGDRWQAAEIREGKSGRVLQANKGIGASPDVSLAVGQKGQRSISADFSRIGPHGDLAAFDASAAPIRIGFSGRQRELPKTWHEWRPHEPVVIPDDVVPYDRLRRGIVIYAWIQSASPLWFETLSVNSPLHYVDGEALEGSSLGRMGSVYYTQHPQVVGHNGLAAYIHQANDQGIALARFPTRVQPAGCFELFGSMGVRSHGNAAIFELNVAPVLTKDRPISKVLSASARPRLRLESLGIYHLSNQFPLVVRLRGDEAKRARGSMGAFIDYFIFEPLPDEICQNAKPM